MPDPSDVVIKAVFTYFKALSEPTRLKILYLLQDGECNVGDLVKKLGCSQGNVSKHLNILLQQDIVQCRNQGNITFYYLSDTVSFSLVDEVIKLISKDVNQQVQLFRTRGSLTPGLAEL